MYLHRVELKQLPQSYREILNANASARYRQLPCAGIVLSFSCHGALNCLVEALSFLVKCFWFC